MTAEVNVSNEAAIKRLAARRELRTLQRTHKKVPPELRERAGFTNGAPQPSSRKTVERALTKVVGTDAATRTMVNGTTKGRQFAAKELGIKNRRWMTVVELDEAIALKKDDVQSIRIAELEHLGRQRCKAAWDAWKAKQPVAREDKDGGDAQ